VVPFRENGEQRRMSEGAKERGEDPRAPAPFVPDEADAPRDPDTGAIRIDEPDVGEPPDEPEIGDTSEDDPERAAG
jgi:hypothetical protein